MGVLRAIGATVEAVPSGDEVARVVLADRVLARGSDMGRVASRGAAR